MSLKPARQNLVRLIHTLLVLAAQTCLLSAQSQPVRVHSHNDYLQKEPFWYALRSGCASIEVDVVMRQDTLYVAHEPESIERGNTLGTLYLSALEQALKAKQGSSGLILLIDIKTAAVETLSAVIEEIERYPSLVRYSGEEHIIKFVISGNRPLAADYGHYPDFILFDHQDLEAPPESVLEKIAMVSLSYRRFASGKARHRIKRRSQRRIRAAVDFAASLGKPLRLWGTPDNSESWQVLRSLELDFVGTDKPKECNEYFKIDDD